MTEKNKPAHTIRGSAGSGLKVTIWRHESDKGPWFTATPTRSYKTQDGQWKESTSFNQEQWLELGEMFREARTWALKEQAAAKSAGHAQDTEDAAHADREDERKRAGGHGR